MSNLNLTDKKLNETIKDSESERKRRLSSPKENNNSTIDKLKKIKYELSKNMMFQVSTFWNPCYFSFFGIG